MAQKIPDDKLYNSSKKQESYKEKFVKIIRKYNQKPYIVILYSDKKLFSALKSSLGPQYSKTYIFNLMKKIRKIHKKKLIRGIYLLYLDHSTSDFIPTKLTNTNFITLKKDKYFSHKIFKNTILNLSVMKDLKSGIVNKKYLANSP
jgi:hypothetical protein